MQRLRWCCREYHVSPEALAQKFKFLPEDGIDKLNEKGTTIKQLESVASFFDRDILFFLAKEPISQQKAYSPLFRTLAGQRPDLGRDAKLLIRRVEEYRDFYRALLEEDEDLQPRPWEGSFGARAGSGPVALAEAAREWLGLAEGKSRFNELRTKVENKGILVFMSTNQSGKRLLRLDDDNNIRGFSLYDKVSPAIVIKKMAKHGDDRVGESIQTFTLMHELGHLIQHKGNVMTQEGYIYSTKRKERQANLFAANLLVPRSKLEQLNLVSLKSLDARRFKEAIKPHARNCGVNPTVLALRLVAEKLIDQKQYDAYDNYNKAEHAQFAAKQEKRKIPRNRARETYSIFGELYTSAVLQALSGEHITLDKASAFLGDLRVAKISELRKVKV